MFEIPKVAQFLCNFSLEISKVQFVDHSQVWIEQAD